MITASTLTRSLQSHNYTTPCLILDMVCLRNSLCGLLEDVYPNPGPAWPTGSAMAAINQDISGGAVLIAKGRPP